MRNHCVQLIRLLAVVFLPLEQTAAQVYVVVADNAKFMDAATEVAAAVRGSEIYALEEKDGWLKAVEPKSQLPAWVAKSAVKQKIWTQAQAAEIEQLTQLSDTILEFVNATAVTTAEVQQTAAWAERMTLLRGDKHPATGAALEYAGLVAQNGGAYAQAETFLNRALNVHLQLYGKKSPETASIYLDLARLALDSGDLQTGVGHAKTAWQINRDALGADHPEALGAMLPAAAAMEMIEDYEDALGKYRFVHENWLKHYGEKDFRTLQVAANIARQLHRLDRKSEAIPIYENVIRTLEAEYPQKTRNLALTRLRLASAKLDPDDSESVQSFRNAVAKIQQDFPYDAPYVRSEQKQLLQTLLASGQIEAGFQLADTILRQLRNSIRREFWGMTPDQQRDYLAFADGYTFFQAISLATDFAERAEVMALASEWLINGKGLVQEAQSVQAGASFDLKKREAWAEESWVSLAEVRTALPEGAVWVDILHYLDFDFESAGMPGQTGYRYAAWMSGSNGDVRLIDLGPADAIHSATAALQSEFATFPQTIRISSEDAAWKSLQSKLLKVSQLVWHPIAAAAGGATRMIVSPDQSMWLLPWSALLNEDGTFAVESCQIQLELSGRELVKTGQGGSRNQSVIFADPMFDSTIREPVSGQTRSIEKQNFGGGESLNLPVADRLEWSAQEAALISPTIEALTGHSPEMLLEKRAVESSFKQLRGPEILVMSTHGFFLDADKKSTSGSGSRSLSSEVVSISESQTNPLLQCGLLLAGANQHRSIDRLDNDGVLTGLEIAATDLKGTRLAVLSACETGLGDLEATGGVVGLRRAFHVAGSQAVLASLWQVPDRDTAVLMQGFFKSLAESRDVGSALQSTQLRHIETRRRRFGVAHPYYWAAFTLTGHADFSKQ